MEESDTEAGVVGGSAEERLGEAMRAALVESGRAAVQGAGDALAVQERAVRDGAAREDAQREVGVT